MFTIPTYLGKSDIHGIGVFSGVSVKKGDIIWELTDGIDIIVPEEVYSESPESVKQFLHNFAFLSSTGEYILCTDNAKYTNHSLTANMEQVSNQISIATMDIQGGDEITENYYLFDGVAADKLF